MTSTKMRDTIDFAQIAIDYIDDVARELMPERLIFSKTDAEIRFGNHGSFSVNKSLGTFYDFEEAVGGGLLKMICHLTNLEHEKQAVDWLQEKGFINGTFTPAERTRRPKTQPRTKATGDMFKVGLKLWSQAKPIPFYQQHPVRRWCLYRNLFPGYKELPPTIRWHDEKSLIIVALAPLHDFISSYPDSPDAKQFHLIAIDRLGRKRNAFPQKAPTDDKRTYGTPSVTCVALFGEPNASEINICEGIADAFAIFSREPGAVIASIMTLNKIANCETLINHLTASNRIVTLFSDNDEAGRRAQDKLARTLYDRGGDIFYHDLPAKDPAAAAAMEGNHE